MHRSRAVRPFVPRSTLVAALVLLASTGCFERRLAAVAPCTRATVGHTLHPILVEDVDLLFVVDDSNSMTEEQSELVHQIPHLVEALASGDLGLDGTIDFHPARTIHVGIVSTDMGVASATDVTSCTTGVGDDGLLRTAGSRCTGAQRGPVFSFDRGGDARAFAMDVGCAANLGTAGCGEEQPLESMLKALSPSQPQVWTIPGYSPPPFLFGTGHGGAEDENAGLVRDDSVLAIILISDENDSSTGDPNLFSDTAPYAAVNLNLRGLAFPQQLYPIQRYVDGLLALRTEPGHLVFGAIVGMPVEASGLSPDDVLRLDAMQEREDPSRQGRLLAACRGPLQTEGAYPGRRAVELARDLRMAGAGASVSSICDDTFEDALDQIVQRIGDALRETCLPRALNPDAEGQVSCEVEQILPAIGSAPDERTHCSALGDAETYRLVRTENVEIGGQVALRQVCALRQLQRDEIGGTSPGWFYDDASPDVAELCPHAEGGRAQRISFQGVTIVSGSDVRLSCDEVVAGQSGEITIGSFCNPAAAADPCAAGLAPDQQTPLVCDPFTRSCGVPCSIDAECTVAGVAGELCDDRTAAEFFGARLPEGMDPHAVHGMCLNATCE